MFHVTSTGGQWAFGGPKGLARGAHSSHYRQGISFFPPPFLNYLFIKVFFF